MASSVRAKLRESSIAARIPASNALHNGPGLFWLTNGVSSRARAITDVESVTAAACTGAFANKTRTDARARSFMCDSLFSHVRAHANKNRLAQRFVGGHRSILHFTP